MENQQIYRSVRGAEQIRERYDRALASWPGPAQPLTLATRHGETFAMANGSLEAPPLLLFHGSGSNLLSWMGVVPALSARYRVYAIDMIGEPGRSAPNRPPLDSQAYREWLDDLYAALGLEKATLTGMSLGGWLAMQYAVYAPSRVTALALVAPGGVCPARVSFFLKAMLWSLAGAYGRRRVRDLVLNGQPIPEELAEFMDLLAQQYHFRREPLPIPTDEALQRLSMPVLYLAGARDALLDTPKSAARLQRLLPQLTVQVIPEAGHALTDPGPALLEFFAAHIPSALA